MKIFTVIFCLLLSVSAWGQNNNTILKDSARISVTVDTPRSLESRPLIILDDTVYKADLKTIDQNGIMSIDVLKGNSATAIYGKQAASGAIIIKSKRYRQIDTAIDKDALYIIDGLPSKNKLNDISPNDILSINILKKGKGPDPSLQPVTDIVIVVTKANAIKQYQKKFSAFSKKYKKYLDDHNGGDSRITYFISNGEILRTDNNKSIKILYEIHQDKIDKVSFSIHKNAEDITMITVGIDLKK